MATTTTRLQEPWSRERDAAHPVRWSPADGDTPAYLTLKGAAERLASYYGDPERDVDFWTGALQDGRPLRTPFAFYQVDEAGR